ncbi:MAG TPA: nuclear transport factor 2 family protein [Solirubrobacteraceae bacterium]|jgi:hypothetical protein|nr:nuclear transport factor 2 family protein [Solirubrobacteraceae bacterium]
MSEESTTPGPVELTRSVYAHLNSRDLDAIVGMMGPASVWDGSQWDLGIHTGPHAIRRFFESWFGGLAEYGVRVREMQDLGNGVVFVVHVAHRAATDGGYLELEAAPVYQWVEGTLARMTLYSGNDEGRAAAEQLARLTPSGTEARRPRP